MRNVRIDIQYKRSEFEALSEDEKDIWDEALTGSCAGFRPEEKYADFKDVITDEEWIVAEYAVSKSCHIGWLLETLLEMKNKVPTFMWFIPD